MFCYFIALILCLKKLKDLRANKNVKQRKFEAIWGKLESKKCLQRQ